MSGLGGQNAESSNLNGGKSLVTQADIGSKDSVLEQLLRLPESEF